MTEGATRRAGPPVWPMFALAALFSSSIAARAQADAPIPNEPMDPTVQYPGPDAYVLQYDPANSLAYVDANANSVSYSDRVHGPLNVAVEAKGSWTDNLFDSPSSTVSHAYFSAGTDVGYKLVRNTMRFAANYRLDGDIYPGYGDFNSISQVYLHQLQSNLSPRANITWDLTAGRVTSLGQYLPTIVPVGGIGVAAPTLSSDVLQNSYIVTNAVTNVSASYELSRRDSLRGAVTGGWIEEAQQQAAPGFAPQVLRSVPLGANVQWSHLISPRTALGFQLTELYIRGLAPAGHGEYVAAQPTYLHNFTKWVGLRLAGGPLYNQAQSASVRQSGVSYAVNVALDYTRQYSRIELDYSRVVELEYQDPSTIAHQVSFVFDRAVTRNIDLTVDTRLLHSDAATNVVPQTDYGVTARLDRYIGGSFAVFFYAARFARNSPATATGDVSYGRDEVSVGLKYLFGNPLERQGSRR